MKWLDRDKIHSLNNKSCYLTDEVSDMFEVIIAKLEYMRCKTAYTLIKTKMMILSVETLIVRLMVL